MIFSKRITTLSICALLLIALSLNSIIANGVTTLKKDDKSTLEKGSILSFDGDNCVVAHNDKYNLVCCKNPVSFLVTNRETSETIFSTSVSETKYDVQGSSSTWKNYMQAIVAIKYADKDECKGTVIQDFSSASTTNVSLFAVKNGVWIDLYFTKPKIGFSVIVRLNGSSIDVSIPQTTIKENDRYELISTEIFPFMGATPSDEEGYIMYPDGAGALTYFNKVKDKHLYTQAYSIDVYSTLNQENLDDMTDCAMLPVYGIKTGEKAFLAAITDGDDSATIKVNPSINTAAVKLNRASFELIYRNSHRFYLSNIVVNNKDVATNIYGTEWDEEIISGDRSVKFFILEGNNADYSGMANVYREYLISSGNLKQNATVNDYRTSVSMIMGAIEKTMFASNYVTATSFTDVADFIKQYNKAGMDNYLVTLSGWNKGGINNYNTFYKPESELGGSKGLEKLNELNGNIYLETDIISNKTERNSIKQGNLIPVTNADETRFIAELDVIGKKFNKLQRNMKKYTSLNVAYLKMGKNIFYNAGDSSSSRLNEILKFRELLSKTDRCSVDGGNLYLLNLVGYVYNIPTDTSDNVIIDEEIPFVGMVVYGSIPYSGESGNNSSNFSKTKLKWLEYGCIPYFEITGESPQKLQNSDRNFLYSSRNDCWKERVVECNKEWNDTLSVLCGAHMVKHQRIGDTLYKTDYSNGYYTVINYSNKSVDYNGKVIDAESYILGKE